MTLNDRVLPLRSTRLTAIARAGLARVELQQTFFNPYPESLHVTYKLPLPADGAVSGVRFVVGEHEVTGRVQARMAARQHFEDAILEGRTAALLAQERSSLFTQAIGNIPPQTEVEVDITVDQPLVWIREGSVAGWEWRFPTVIGPRYVGPPRRIPDAAAVATATTADVPSIEVQASLTIHADRVEPPRSPSHRLAVVSRGNEHHVTLADPHLALDRDIVVQWATSPQSVGIAFERARLPAEHPRGHEVFGLLTLTPPADLRTSAPIARDLIVVLDTSGSMDGHPLQQAKRVVGGLIHSLGADDRLELVEFSTSSARWRPQPVPATAAHREDALRWLGTLRASGGTDMVQGLVDALANIRAESQRQVILVSDGYIGFEDQVIRTVLARLPPQSRLHTLGVGSSVNRTLTEHAARAGRGVEVIIGIDEDPERGSQRLRSATEYPVIVDLEVDGDAVKDYAPTLARDLLADAPSLLSIRLASSGGQLRISGRTGGGRWEWTQSVPPTPSGHGPPILARRYAREMVTDLEMRRASSDSETALSALDLDIERHGLDFQIATRRTSWVASSAAPTVDPSGPHRTQIIPHAIPHGTSIAGFGLRRCDVAPLRDPSISTVIHKVADPTVSAADPPVPSLPVGKSTASAAVSPIPHRPIEDSAPPAADPPVPHRPEESSFVSEYRAPRSIRDDATIGRDDSVITVVHRRHESTVVRAAEDSCIVVIYGPELGRKYNIRGRELTIGRSMSCDVCIAQDSISRIHAMIAKDDERVMLRDNESTNGTYVNDARIHTAFLKDGDLIKIGRSIFKFLAGDNVESAYHEEIYRLTTVDGLTEIFNKRYFSETLKRELSRARRYCRPLALLMFDIDHFKRHNDTYGHRAGDHVLYRLAQLVRKRSRKVDIPARYGGEEFAIILPEIGLSQAASFAETLRRMVEEASFVFEGRDIEVTISIGVAALEPQVTSADEFVQLADSRLYRAKQAGRNRVVST